MTNKSGPVGIVWTHPRLDEESSHWLGIGMGMENPDFFN